jgi:hypothetical protein
MKYTKTIICLANSRKWSGRCIAGKEKTKRGVGEWIRPVSKRSKGEIFKCEQMCQNREDANLLDIIEVPMLKPQPNKYQTENHLIDDRNSWRKIGQLDKSQLHLLTDKIEGDLWINGHSSYNGLNDRIPEEKANMLCNSLYFIQLVELLILVCTEGIEFRNEKRKVRAKFHFHNIQYKLVVTDPLIEETFLKKSDGEYPLCGQDIYACISIGEPYKNYCYKLIASIII